MVLLVQHVAVEIELEIAVVGWQVDGLDAFDQLLAVGAVGDEVLDRAELEAVLLPETQQLRDAGHRAVVVDDFRQDPGGTQTGEAGEIDGGLGVSGPAQDSAGAVAERENMAGPHEVAGRGGAVGEEPDRAGAVGGGNAGGDAPGGIDADRVGRAHPLGVGFHRGHQRQFEAV